MKKTAEQIATEVLQKVGLYETSPIPNTPMSKAPGVTIPKINAPNPWDKNAPKAVPQMQYNAARPIPKNPMEQSSPATTDLANPNKRMQNMMPKNQIAKPVPAKPMTPKSQSLNTGSST